MSHSLSNKADKMTKIIERVYSRRPSRENILRDLYLCALGERYLKPIMAAPVKPATMEELKVMVDGMRVSEDPERFGRKPRRFDDRKGGKKSDQTCTYCKKKGHNDSDCWTKQKDEKRGKDKKTGNAVSCDNEETRLMAG